MVSDGARGPSVSEPSIVALETLLMTSARGLAPAPKSEGEQHRVSRLMFTSGSTGEPKGVLHTMAATVFANAKINEHLRIDEQSRQLVFIPATLNWGLFHVIQTVVAGCYLRFIEGFDPAEVLAGVSDDHITHFGGPPTALIALVAAASDSPASTNSLVAVTSAGASSSVETVVAARHALGCPILDGYGMTEAGGSLTPISATLRKKLPEPSARRFRGHSSSYSMRRIGPLEAIAPEK